MRGYNSCERKKNTDLLQRGGPSKDGGEFTQPLMEVGVPFAQVKMEEIIQKTGNINEYFTNTKEKLNKLLAVCQHITKENKTEAQACEEECVSLAEFKIIMQELSEKEFNTLSEVLVTEDQWRSWEDKLLSDICGEKCIAPDSFTTVSILLFKMYTGFEDLPNDGLFRINDEDKTIPEKNFTLGLKALEYYYGYGYSCKKIGKKINLSEGRTRQLMEGVFQILRMEIFRDSLRYGIHYLDKMCKAQVMAKKTEHC